MTEPEGTTEHVVEPDALPLEVPRPRLAMRVFKLICGVALTFIILYMALGAVALIFYVTTGDIDPFDSTYSKHQWILPIFGIMLYGGSGAIAWYLMKRHARRLAWGFGGLFVVIVIAWAGWSGYGYWRFDSELDAWLDAAGQRGALAIENPEYFLEDTADADGNAARLYTAAYKATSGRFEITHTNGRFYEPDVSQTFTGFGPEQIPVAMPIEEVRDRIRAYDATIDAIDEASRLPRCRGTDWNAIENLAKITTAAIGLAKLEEHDDKIPRLALLRLRLARHAFEDSPSWGGDFIATGLEGETIGLLVEDPPQLKAHQWGAIADELRKADPWVRVHQTMIHASAHDIVDGRDRGNWRRPDGILANLGMHWLDVAEVARRGRVLIERTDPTVYRNAAPIAFTATDPWWAMRSQGYGPDGIAAIDSAAAADRFIRKAECFARIARYRVMHGTLPASLDEVPDAPDDPTTGEPFVYSSGEKGFTLAPSKKSVSGSVMRWNNAE